MEGWKDVDRPQSLFYFVPQEKELCCESHIQTGLAWKDVVPVQYCSGSMMEWDGRGEWKVFCQQGAEKQHRMSDIWIGAT